MTIACPATKEKLCPARVVGAGVTLKPGARGMTHPSARSDLLDTLSNLRAHVRVPRLSLARMAEPSIPRPSVA